MGTPEITLFPAATEKKRKRQILLLRWLIFILDKELTGEPALSLWENYYLLAVSNTGCQLSIKKKKKKPQKTQRKIIASFAQSSLAQFWGKEGSYKWDAAVKHMIGTQQEISFW